MTHENKHVVRSPPTRLQQHPTLTLTLSFAIIRFPATVPTFLTSVPAILLRWERSGATTADEETFFPSHPTAGGGERGGVSIASINSVMVAAPPTTASHDIYQYLLNLSTSETVTHIPLP